MSVEADVLRELHGLHLNLEDVRLQLDRGPKQLEARRQHTERKQKEVEQAEKELQRLRMLADQKELSLKSGEQKISELTVRLNVVKTNREYQAVLDQIDADKMSISVLEDEILDTFARVDEHRSKVRTLKEEFDRARREMAELQETVHTQGKRLAARLEELQEKISRAKTKLDENARPIYDRLVAARGADAMADVAGGTCNGCHTAITPQMQNELLLNRLVCCKSCGRLLYMAE